MPSCMGNLTVRRPSDGAASPARGRHAAPDAADREHAARCERLATVANHCAGFGLAGGLGFVCLLGALASGG